MTLQIEDSHVAHPHRSSCQHLSHMFSPAERRAAAVDLFDHLSQTVHLGLRHFLDWCRGERRANPAICFFDDDVAAGRNVDFEILQGPPTYPKHRGAPMDRTADLSQRAVIVAQNFLDRCLRRRLAQRVTFELPFHLYHARTLMSWASLPWVWLP